jgi:hypothetical protein
MAAFILMNARSEARPADRFAAVRRARPAPGRPARSQRQGAKAFCLRLIEATASEVLAFKPNAAFFEALARRAGRRSKR